MLDNFPLQNGEEMDEVSYLVIECPIKKVLYIFFVL